MSCSLCKFSSKSFSGITHSNCHFTEKFLFVTLRFRYYLKALALSSRSTFLNPSGASVALTKKPVNWFAANQLTGFYMRATLALDGLMLTMATVNCFDDFWNVWQGIQYPLRYLAWNHCGEYFGWHVQTTHFWPIFYFYTPWKRQKTSNFWRFQGL